MTVQGSEQLARRFVATVLTDGVAPEDLYTSDATVWHNTDQRCLSMRAGDALRFVTEVVPDFGPRGVVVNAWDEGFVIRTVMTGTLPDGNVVGGPSCIVGMVRDGRIATIEEYIDSAQFALLSAAFRAAGVGPGVSRRSSQEDPAPAELLLKGD